MLPYVIHNRRDGSRIDRSLCLKRLDVVERIGIKQLRKNKRPVKKTRLNSVRQGQRLIQESNLGSVVLGGGDEHGEVH